MTEAGLARPPKMWSTNHHLAHQPLLKPAAALILTRRGVSARIRTRRAAM
jgi:hypothetical protein